jgi:chromosome segregation ATPase
MTWLYAAGVGLVCAVLWLWEKGKVSDLEAEVKLLKAQCRDLLRQYHAEEDRGDRLEKVVAYLRQDLADVEKELRGCGDADAVRERIQRLLSSPFRRY